MPYAGEQPITSFFPRISSTAKRRENASLSSHKRKRSSVAEEELNGRATKKKKGQENQPLCNAELNGSGPRMSTFATRSAVGRIQSTPAPGPSLPCPRSQIEDSRRDESAIVDNTSRPVIPTPRRSSHHSPSITNECSTPSTGFTSHLPPKLLGQGGSLICSSLSVPSSQSQDSGYESLFCDSVLSETGSFPPSPPIMPFLSSSKGDTAESNLPDDLLIVESSQSQPILPLASLPRDRGHRNSASSLSTNYSGTDIIPSSQSQEMEQLLATSGAEWKANLMYATHIPAVGSPTPLPPFILGTRIHDDPVAVEEFGTKPRIEAFPCQQNLDDSETEDESDDEAPDNIFAKGKGDGVARIQESVDDLSRQSRIPQSGDDENSLPSVLTDFMNMFGDGDGSYPDDFPFSLR